MKVTSFTPFSSSRLPCHYMTQNYNNDPDRRLHRKLPSSRSLSHSRFCLTITSLLLLIVFVGSCDAWFSFYTSQLATKTPTTEQEQQQDLPNRTALNTTSSASKDEEGANSEDSVIERSKRQTEDTTILTLNETVTDEAELLPTPLPVAEAKDNPESVVTDNDAVEPDSNSTSSPNNSSNTLPCPWFTCKNGRCVIDTWRCDLQDDCGDGSDEDGCDELTECPAPVNGGTPSFRCRSGMCISSAWICDSFKDCPHGDDEINCQDSKKEGRG